MAILRAPDRQQFPVVQGGAYLAKVVNVSVEDFTEKPDRFGNKGHHAITFRWQLAGMETDDGAPVEIPQTVKFATGDYLAKQGQRMGRLPWLTEITRAFGTPDIQPGDAVDTDTWIGKEAVLSIQLNRTADGMRNHIEAVDKPGSAPAGPRVLKPRPPAPPGGDEGDIPF